MAEFDAHATIEDAIDSLARGMVKRSKEADREVEYMTMEELIQAENFRARKVAAAKPGLGLRLTKLVPPGAG